MSNKIPKAWLEWNAPKTASSSNRNKQQRVVIREAQPFRRDEGKVYKSAELCYNVSMKPERKVYTGTLVKGIATMHKSNAVPIINDEQAKDIAQMRRN